MPPDVFCPSTCASTLAVWKLRPEPSKRKPGTLRPSLCAPRFLLSAMANHEPGGAPFRPG